MSCVRHPSLYRFPPAQKSPAEETDSCFGQCLEGGAGEERPGRGCGFREVEVALLMTGLFSQTVSLDFVVLGSGLTVIGMSHFLVIGGLEPPCMENTPAAG